MKQRIPSNKTWIDVFAIVLLVLLHPVLYRLDASAGYFPPDSIAYLNFAENALAKGLLHTGSAVSGSGMVLPPFYPLLMLVGNFFVDDFILTSEWVSSAAVIASSIAFYLIIRHYGNPYFAFVGALGIQLNYQLNYWALTPLTEATFMLVFACLLLSLVYVIGSKRVWAAAVIGMLVALLFLTRQIGIVMIPYFLLVLLALSLRKFPARGLALLAGFALLFAPYVLILQDQGSQAGAQLSPFEQRWSTQERISIDDLDDETQEWVRQVYSTRVEDYVSVYVKRRELRQLLPDNSAMLQSIDMNPSRTVRQGVSGQLYNVWNRLPTLGGRVLDNFRYLYDSIGFFASALFLVTLITPVWIKVDHVGLLSRYVLGGAVIFYVFSLSLVTGLIDRYVMILAPFAILHIIVEIICLLQGHYKSRMPRGFVPAVFAVAVAGIVLLQPKNFLDVQLRPKGSLQQMGESNFRQFVEPGEPILSIGAFHAYVAGGSWRTLPNDSLEKVAKYAALKKVRWMVVSHKPQSEVATYRYAKSWYLDKQLLRQYRHLVTLRAVSRDGGSFLYEFTDE